MSQLPLVSIVCLCYNHESYVLEALESARRQSYPRIEILVVDDCSTDKSASNIKTFVERHPEIKFFLNADNLGNTQSFNRALAAAKGDYIIDLAADDVLCTDCVENQVRFFLEQDADHTFLVYGNTALISQSGSFIRHTYPVDLQGHTIDRPFDGEVYRDLLSQKYPLNSVSALVNTKLLKSLNGYDETLAYEDLDLWIRASRHYHIKYLDRVLIHKRVLSNSMGAQSYQRTKLSRKINESTYKIFVKVLKLNRSKSEDFAVLRRIHYEMEKNLKTRNGLLLVKLAILELKFRYRKL